MAAFELAIVQERAGSRELAVEWYTVAVQRFRRPEWKKKAEEALVRLGAPVPAPPEPGATASAQAATPEIRSGEFNFVGPDSEPALYGSGDVNEHAEPADKPLEASGQSKSPKSTLFGSGDFNSHEEPADQARAANEQAEPLVPGQPRKRRRGRRGGRGRRRKPGAAVEAAAKPTAAAQARPIEPRDEEEAPQRATPFAVPPSHRDAPVSFLRDPDAAPASTSFLPRARAGDPALSSRLAPLESQLRRLLAAAPSPVEEAPTAPAGPGVFLLSDSDQTTYYYVESCQTLRIGIANLLRTASRGRGPAVQGEPVRNRLAEHLGITQARAPKYLKDNCVVRWLQLDDGASHLAHFATAILRPALND